MPSPSALIRVLLYPLICGKVPSPKVNRIISCTGSGVSKSDGVIAKRYLSVVDIALVVDLLLRLIRYPIAIAEIELGKPVFRLIKGLGIVICMRPPFPWGDAKVTLGILAAKATLGNAQRVVFLTFPSSYGRMGPGI
jgi:hypothetical protein